ncbi:hypothetical protein P7C73_g920, partial [Tremellales sp. Uapishka_1]
MSSGKGLRLSAPESQLTPNIACCTLPPVQAEYTPKGSYSDLAGLKTYTVGEASAKKAIVLVYDIFGFTPQILQGADLLASQGYKVVMPDFMDGAVANGAWFSPDATPEQTEAKGKFFGSFPGSISSQHAPFGKVVEALKSAGAEKVGAVGYCWGYKVIVSSPAVKELGATAGAHPSFPAPEDADTVSGVPLCLLPSKDEDMKIMNAIFEGVEAKNKGQNVLKHFDSVPHGWMAARGDLSGGPATDSFVDGYQTLANFFKKHL